MIAKRPTCHARLKSALFGGLFGFVSAGTWLFALALVIDAEESDPIVGFFALIVALSGAVVLGALLGVVCFRSRAYRTGPLGPGLIAGLVGWLGGTAFSFNNAATLGTVGAASGVLSHFAFVAFANRMSNIEETPRLTSAAPDPGEQISEQRELMRRDILQVGALAVVSVALVGASVAARRATDESFDIKIENSLEVSGLTGELQPKFDDERYSNGLAECTKLRRSVYEVEKSDLRPRHRDPFRVESHMVRVSAGL